VSTSLGTTTTDGSGNYSLGLPVNTYDVSVSRFGYATDTVTGVSITDGNTTTLNVPLQPSPSVTVNGTITDGSGHGWPLYTRIDVAGDPDSPFFTDPVTGKYSIQLPANASYDVIFSSQLTGYQPVELTVPVSGTNMTQDEQVPALPNCTAPGYATGSPCVVVPGGLVEGNVSDLNTGNPINRARIQSNDASSDKTTSVATPDDPNNPDGFYYLFSSLTGSHAFTASASLHANDTETVSVAGDSAVRKDFKLGTGDLTVSATSLATTEVLGSTTTKTLTFGNNGTGPVHVKLSERGGSFQILQGQGAQLNNIHLGESNQASPAWVGDLTRDNMPPTNAGSPKDSTWLTIAQYPTSIMDNNADIINGKEYSVGGVDSTFATTNKGWVYDAGANAWSPIANMTIAREKPGVAAVNGKLYVTGGWDTSGSPVATTEVYDPNSNAWATVSPNPSPTAAPGVAVVDNKIYFVGGCADGFCTPSNKVEVYDTSTDTWSSAANYPSGDSWEGCGGINGQVYCAGGISGSSSLTTANAYDPSSDSWSPIANVPADIWGGVSGAPNGMLVLSGGVINNGGTITNEGFAYDPSTNSWTSIPNAQFSRYRGGGGCGYYKVGGSSGGFSPTADSEFLSGLDQCGFTNLPWLDENPPEFDVSVGQTVTVAVTLSATTANTIQQPGAYAGQIAVSANTPQTINPIGVTMNVTPPKGWGKLQGTLTGTDCNNKSAPLKGVVFATGKSFSWTAKSDSKTGAYAFWGPQESYSLIASANGWIPQTTSVSIKQGKTVTADFTLRPTSC
jgi:N-acetylneuraminic acid mutarotase